MYCRLWIEHEKYPEQTRIPRETTDVLPKTHPLGEKNVVTGKVIRIQTFLKSNNSFHPIQGINLSDTKIVKGSSLSLFHGKTVTFSSA